LFSKTFLLLACLAGIVLTVLAYALGKKSAKRKLEQIEREGRITGVLNAYLDNALDEAESHSSGYSVLLQAGVLTLRNDEEIRDLLKRIVIHGEKNPLGKDRDALKETDLYHFFSIADSEKINFDDIDFGQFTEKIKAIQSPIKKKTKARKVLIFVGIVLILELIFLQFVPVDMTNPPVESDISAAEPVKAILKRACYDCHSNETVWPWYRNIAPVSFLIEKDVKHGREEMNFSTWNRYNEKQKKHLKHEIWEEIEESEMPPLIYTLMHWDARLKKEDKEQLRSWGSEGKKGTEDR
jgi:hypothetical protein